MTNFNPVFTPQEIAKLVEQAIKKGKDLYEMGDFTQAENILKQALRVDSENLEVIKLLGWTCICQTKPEEALSYYLKFSHQSPTEDFAVYNNMALCYATLKKYEFAIAAMNKAIQVNPTQPALHWNLALQYKEWGKPTEAEDVYKAAISKFDNSAELYYHYAIFLAENDRYDEAIINYDKAIAISPDFALAHWNRGLLLVQQGDYPTGLQEFKYRWNVSKEFRMFRERFMDMPHWQGENGNGRTILLYNEQGLGDTIMFLRYVKLLKAKNFRIVVEVPVPLVDLASTVKGVDVVIPLRSPIRENIDCACSMTDLPVLFGTTVETVPSEFPYMQPTGEVPAYAFKDYKSYFKIGICWAGNPAHTRDKERSCYLREFKTIYDIPGVKLFSIQKEVNERFWPGAGNIDLTEDCKNLSVVDMSELLQDMNYTAAIMNAMDLIISVDTAAAHLAGAINKECWLLLPHMCDYRWGKNDILPWYKSLKPFRQNKDEEWKTVFERVKIALQERITTH